LTGESEETVSRENKPGKEPSSCRSAKSHGSLPQLPSLIFSAAIAAFLVFTFIGTTRGGLLSAKLFWTALIGFASYRVFVTGRVSKWRSVFFIVLAWAFILEFKAGLLGLHGSAWLASEIQEVPYCHIAIVSTLLNHLYNQALALSSGNFLQWSPLAAGVLFWLMASLAIGPGWCSWACFYGGLDTMFSRMRKKPVFRCFHLPPHLRDFSLALFVAVLLLSLTSLQPVYCLWICPLKISTGFLDPDTSLRQIQLAIFATIGILFIIVLPLLINKRTFCTFLCPFGAWQYLMGRGNLFRVSINPSVCTLCEQCLKACPIYAIDLKGVREHKISDHCNRCGDCFDACPTGAIDYSILGKLNDTPIPRVLFLIAAWLVGGGVSLLFVPQALVRIFHSLPFWQ